MRILIRTSKWAVWARRFGSLALPLAVLPIFLHRERLITTGDFHIIELIAAAIAGLALFLAVGAFVRLWVTGDQGWSKATLGMLFSLFCLIPFAFVFWLAAISPKVSDVSTDYNRLPEIVSGITSRPVTAAEQAEIAVAFPGIGNRSYPFEPAEMFAITDELVDANGWEIRSNRQPVTALDEGQINAIATGILGWRDEVAIRITGSPQGSEVAMRSVALHDWSDLGENGRRIQNFLAQLDQRITVLLRNVPVQGGEPAEAETAAPSTGDPG
jgi:hypothetical protein